MDQAPNPITSGGLSRLRERFSLSVTMQAHLIGVPPHSLAAWERGSATPSATSMAKVIDWYKQAEEAAENIDELDLIPLTTASQLLGVGMTTVRERCRTGELPCLYLGALGMYVTRNAVR